MNNRISLALATALALGVSGTVSAADAQDPNVGEKSGATPQSAPMTALSLANDLTNYGMEQKDPLALLLAARIRRDTPTVEGDYSKEGGSAEQAEAVEVASVEDLLAQAREYSAGQADILAMIEATPATSTTKGVVDGPVEHDDSVRAGATDTYRNQLTFEGGKPAEILVLGVGGDIDCYVSDENGGSIVSDTDGTSICALSWTPRWEGPFTLKIKNYASRTVPYRIVTN